MKDSLSKTINWSLGIAVITLVLAAVFSVVSTALLNGVTWAVGMLIVFLIVLTGILFDIIGVAATAANEVPLHAMASKKVPGAKQAIFISRNADRVASFCQDVFGDISGIISGTAAAAVVIQLTLQLGHSDSSAFHYVVTVVFTSVVASMTVGGKAFCKTFAIHYATNIVLQVGRLLYTIEGKLKINLTAISKKRKSK
ncbi:hypothetical protein [Bacillus taeanensis]|uniref:CNNM transmembrane domain-containing protein n=1 Tax=Bacillus taeanensis TaxID=273032 RepID=A0A366XWT8_9BACI|nr:hypothetical protein [Bacillus taeanensis]RBW70612.1 hypothetical protein DS031_06270 [Bacillus taeanensis]